jgi:hypothetical protein
MQSRHNRAERLHKKFKYIFQEISSISSTINRSYTNPLNVAARRESITKATEHPINDSITVDGIRDTIDESSNSNAATNVLAEVIQEPLNNVTSAGLSTNFYLFDKPLSNSPTAESTTEMTAMSVKDYSNTETALCTVGKDTSTSKPSITDCTKTATSSLLLNKHTNVKQSVLDKSSNSLENVLKTLKTQNTNCIADSVVPGKCAVLTNTRSMVFARIITGIGMNCVNSNLTSLASVLEIEKKRLQEYKQNRLSQIKQDQKQMTLLSTA